jgi:hypothetical protein
LYRDDGLALIKSTSGRLADKAKKDLCAQFLQFSLKITAQVNHQLVNFLDVTFNLKDGSYSPYRKPDNDPLYIDKRSSHPPSITKQLPASINRRISSLSSSKLAFDSVANVYETALHKSNYNGKHEYSPDKLQQLQPQNGNDNETSSGSTLLLAKMYVQTFCLSWMRCQTVVNSPNPKFT